MKVTEYTRCWFLSARSLPLSSRNREIQTQWMATPPFPLLSPLVLGWLHLCLLSSPHTHLPPSASSVSAMSRVDSAWPLPPLSLLPPQLSTLHQKHLDCFLPGLLDSSLIHGKLVSTWQPGRSLESTSNFKVPQWLPFQRKSQNLPGGLEAPT